MTSDVLFASLTTDWEIDADCPAHTCKVDSNCVTGYMQMLGILLSVVLAQLWYVIRALLLAQTLAV